MYVPLIYLMGDDEVLLSAIYFVHMVPSMSLKTGKISSEGRPGPSVL